MAIRIITDSASDILQSEAQEMGITVLPLTTIFGETEYLDGVDMDHTMFFEKLIETDELPHTSQITPHKFAEAFSAFDPEDQVIYFALSSKLSGTYNSAVLAANDFPNVTVFDTLNVTVGQRILIQYALRLIEEGKTLEEIMNALYEKRGKVTLVALLDTLEYLKRGGRIPSTVALAGALLSIKPVIGIENGEVALIGKARGSKNGNNLLAQKIQETSGIDFSMPFCLAYSGLSDKLLRKYMKDHEHIYINEVDDIAIATIGSTIGTHVGPGAIAICYFAY